MKAAILTEVGTPLAIEQVQIDKPGPQEVIVRTVASGLCHTDYTYMSGAMSCPVPAIFGHEAAGIVEQVGADVTMVKPGDKVVGAITAFCGCCAQCVTGNGHRCDDRPARATGAPSRLSFQGEPVFQFSSLAGFAEQMLVDQRSLAVMPPDMPLDRAALLGCGVLTGVGAVFYRADMKVGQSCVVLGCGGVGLNVIQGARIAGASRIIAVDTNADKLALAKKVGATDLISGGPEAVDALYALMPKGVDHAFEVAGLTVTARQGLMMLGKGGRLTLIGIPNAVDLDFPFYPFLAKEVEVTGTLTGSAPAAMVLPKLADYYLKGDLLLDDLISERIALEQVNDSYEKLLAGETTRSVIMFDA